MSVNEDIKSDIVPWALPGEDIPFNISWPSTSTYDKIEIITSDDMIITKLVNVLEYKRLTENSIEIYKLKQVEGGPSYFGGTAVLRSIPTELKLQRIINLKFWNQGQVINEEIPAKVFRPHLTLTECPEKIELRKGQIPKIQLSMKYSGFGDISIKIIGTIKGKEVTRRVPFDLSSFKPFIIDPRDFEALSRGRMSDADLEEFLYSRVQTRTLDLIIDQIDRHPIDNVWLTDAQTYIVTTIEKLGTVNLSIIYSDVMGNTYPKLIRPIQIKSYIEPSDNNPVIIPINITKWDSDPLLNVKEIIF